MKASISISLKQSNTIPALSENTFLRYFNFIKNTGNFYSVSWIVKGKVLAKGVGMEVENSLAVGWRRVKD
jgi:hypothetical protein